MTTKNTPIRTLISVEEFQKKVAEDKSPAMEAARLIATVVQSLPTIPNTEGVTPLAYVVGGYVRDMLLGLSPKDVDVQVYGVAPQDLEIVINSIFPGKVKKVGKSFEILKVELASGEEIDVSISRPIPKEGQEKFEHGDPFVSPELAARLRDFTFNNVAVDPLTVELFDWFGCRADLENGIIRMMIDDMVSYRPVNVYRGIQFAARMELTPDDHYYKVMKEVVSSERVKKLHPRVVRQEWEKLLVKGRKPSLGFEIARSIGLLQSEFPGFVEALDSVDNWNTLLSILDFLRQEKILSLINKERHFVFINSIIIYALPEHERKTVGTSYLNRIAVRGRLAEIVFSLIEGVPELPVLVSDLISLNKNIENSATTLPEKIPPKNKLPGLKLRPGVTRPQSISPKQLKIEKVQNFLKLIAPYTWEEFCVFSNFVGAELEEEIRYINKETAR